MRFKLIFFCSIAVNLNISSAQEWQTIIVENNDSGYIHSNSPAIATKDKNRIDLLYNLITDSTNIIYFRQSTDGCLSFTPRKLIEEVTTPYGSNLRVGSIQYDQDNNLMIFYQHGEYPDWYQRIRKSYDGGNTFDTLLLNYNSDAQHYSSFIWNFNRVGILFTTDQRYRPILLLSYDQGLSFIETDTIPRDNYRPFVYPISIVESGSNHFIAYWEGLITPESPTRLLFNHITKNFNEISQPNIFDSTLQIINTHAVVSYENYIFIVYFGRENGVNDNRKMYFRKSEDYGYTYSEKQVIHDYGTEINVAITPAIKFHPKYGICIALDQYTNGLYFLRSRDLGTTFDPIVKIIDGSQYINHNSISINDSGEIYITSVDAITKSVQVHKSNLITQIRENKNYLIKSFGIINAYPNPLNSSIQIEYKIDHKSQIQINIYNILGEKISKLIDENILPGLYDCQWNSKDDNGNAVSSGVYLLQICADNLSECRKIILLK